MRKGYELGSYRSFSKYKKKESILGEGFNMNGLYGDLVHNADSIQKDARKTYSDMKKIGGDTRRAIKRSDKNMRSLVRQTKGFLF